LIEIHDPRLLRPDRAAFSRALVEAAVARFGARRAEVHMESSICRLEFGPGRLDRAELTRRAASAVRAATRSFRDGAGSWDDVGAIGRIVNASATDGVTSPRAPRRASPNVATSAERSIAAWAASGRLADLARAGASFALAVGGFVLPGLPALPFLILSGRYAARVSPGIERLLMSQSWCAALLTRAEDPSGPTLDWRSLGKTIGLAGLFTAASVILRPPLPLVLGAELGMMICLGWRELGRPAGLKPVLIAA
jgi:uncharacterized membrane protein YbaN (DUF454 family)